MSCVAAAYSATPFHCNCKSEAESIALVSADTFLLVITVGGYLIVRAKMPQTPIICFMRLGMHQCHEYIIFYSKMISFLTQERPRDMSSMSPAIGLCLVPMFDNKYHPYIPLTYLNNMMINYVCACTRVCNRLSLTMLIVIKTVYVVMEQTCCTWPG